MIFRANALACHIDRVPEQSNPIIALAGRRDVFMAETWPFQRPKGRDIFMALIPSSQWPSKQRVAGRKYISSAL